MKNMVQENSTSGGKMMKDDRYEDIPFWERYTLTVSEACRYFHIGDKKFRQILDDYPDADFLLMNGKRIMIKRKRFEQFIDRAEMI